jgi:hypothetical protein
MFGVLCLLAMLDAVYLTADGPKPRPQSIPARWLLKYAPADLPALPATFFDTDWHHGSHPRSVSGGYDEWVRFARDSFTTPPGASITHAASGFSDAERVTKFRQVPLAVYGPLVEYDGNLYTVAITNWETDATKKPRWALNLGAATEVRKNVWYQAGSERFTDGKVRVREYRLEFADDPRTKDEGKVKGFSSERIANVFKGETKEMDGEFVVAKSRTGPRAVTVTFKVGNAVHHVKLQLGDGYYPTVIDGVSRAYPAVLTAGVVPPPKVEKEPTPTLMQPPKKPEK